MIERDEVLKILLAVFLVFAFSGVLFYLIYWNIRGLLFYYRNHWDFRTHFGPQFYHDGAVDDSDKLDSRMQYTVVMPAFIIGTLLILATVILGSDWRSALELIW